MNLPKISSIALAGALAFAWTAAPVSIRAHGDEDDESGSRGEGLREGPHEGHGRRGEAGPTGGPREHDPAMREKFEKMRGSEHKLRETVRKLREGSDAEKAAAKTEAKRLLGEILDARLAMEEDMLAKMEKRAAELKEKIAKKKTGREKMIESKLSRLSGEGDDWD